LNGTIRRKLAEAEEPPSTIGEWQERAVRLDRNQRQSRAEERMLGRNAVCPGGNAQPRGSFGGGSYRGRGGQITWQAGVLHIGGNWGGGGNLFSRGEDRTCYHCEKFGHMARNCWKRNKVRVVEMPQESAKENGGQ